MTSTWPIIDFGQYTIAYAIRSLFANPVTYSVHHRQLINTTSDGDIKNNRIQEEWLSHVISKNGNSE